MSHIGSKEMEYKIGCQGILRKHEDPRVKLYASNFLTEKMCNNKLGVMVGEGGTTTNMYIAEPLNPEAQS
jgi:hypothetical protein